MEEQIWHDEVLPQGWLPTAADIVRSGTTAKFYLAGGTGLALQIGHRISVDLDLFSTEPFDPRRLRDSLRHISGFQVEQIAEDTLHVRANEVQLSFLHYGYPRLFETRSFHGLAVADVRDISCMKLDALASRGTRRDFIDMYFVLQRYSLDDVLGWFDRKYAAAAPNRVHLAKALVYFEDAEQEPMPRLLRTADWPTVKRFFEDLTRRQSPF